MRSIRTLDCTLRDGGRCFGNAWGDSTIKEISNQLVKSGVDIIEIGFLYYLADGISRENTTHFRNFSEIDTFICKDANYVVYIENVLFKKGNYTIVPRKETLLSGIRLGLLKDEIEEAEKTMIDIIEKGYQLYIQGINILSYNNSELEKFISIVNRIHPYAFAIVDTYGNMTMKELKDKFDFINKHLDQDIIITLHSHNNMQLSFALAMTFIAISEDRDIIIDATLNGIGMGAGNLNTELLMQYLNTECNAQYNVDIVLDLIEKYVSKFKKNFLWGYSAVAYDASKKWASQIETSYILTRYSNISKSDQRYLIAMCPIERGVGPEKIDEYYRMICAEYPLKKKNYDNLLKELENEEIMIIGRGHSVEHNIENIRAYVEQSHANVIYLNFDIPNLLDLQDTRQYYFFSRETSYNEFVRHHRVKNIIHLAGISKWEKSINEGNTEYILHVKEITKSPDEVYNDAVLWVLNLINSMFRNKKITIAGFDGDKATEMQIKQYKKYISKLKKNNRISFHTSSRFDEEGK